MQYMDADDWSEASTAAMSLIAAGEIPLRRDRDTGMLRRDARTSLYPELAPIPVSTTTHNPSPSAHKCTAGLEAVLP
jgi:hypothetical protein